MTHVLHTYLLAAWIALLASAAAVTAQPFFVVQQDIAQTQSRTTHADTDAASISALIEGAAGSEAPFRWVQTPIEAPHVTHHTFDSALLGESVSIHVLIPPAYHVRPGERFPVLYWLHGSGGGREGIRPLSQMFASAIRDGLTAPFLVVFIESPTLSLWVDACEGAPVESLIVRELVAFVDGTFRTRPQASGRWLEGFSMGGFGALRLALLYPDVFGQVSSLAAGPLSPDLSQVPRLRRGRQDITALLEDLYCGELSRYQAAHPWTLAEQAAHSFENQITLRLVIGERDNSLANKVRFHEHLSSLGIEHSFIIVPGVGHRTLPLLEGLAEARWGFYPQDS